MGKFFCQNPGGQVTPLPLSVGAHVDDTYTTIDESWLFTTSWQGCRGDGSSIPIPITYPQKILCVSHRIPIPTEPQNPTYPYGTLSLHYKRPE